MAQGQDFAGVTKTLRDAAYVLIGLGLMGLSRAESQRRALQAKLSSPDVEQTVAAVRQQVTERARSVDVDAALAALRRQMAERAPSVDVDATIDEGRGSLGPPRPPARRAGRTGRRLRGVLAGPLRGAAAAPRP